MVKVCIHCNRKYPDGNITFHKFPSDKERRKKWLSAMKIPYEDVDKNSYLCSEHFAEKTFSYQVINKVVHRFLYIDAVPSIFEDINKKPDIVTDSRNDIETSQENENVVTVQVCEQNQIDEEDCYYYKIVNGVIHRFLKSDLNASDLEPVSRVTTDEKRYDETKSETVLNTVETEVKLDQKTVDTKESPKVKVLPVYPQPVEMWNGEINSKESICDFKINLNQDQNQEPKPIYEDIIMDTNDVNLEIINNYSYLNGLNEVEVSSYEPEISEVTHQEEISFSDDYAMNTEVSENLIEDTVEEDETYEPVPKKRRACKRNFSMNEPKEITESKSMKTLLYKFLENKDNSDLDTKLKKYTKYKLTQLLKTALNYIECLEDKLKVTTEQNTLYEKQVLQLENLLQSIGDNEPNKNALES